MTTYAVLFESGGVADWGAPVRKDEQQSLFPYTTRGAVRLTLDGTRKIYLKVDIAGVDDITSDGAVPSGFGQCQFQDIDGDVMLARVDWYMEGDQDKGRITFTSGTGKWDRVEGTVTMDLFGIPGDLESAFPPKGPATFIGFTEGAGSLTAPNLS